MTSVTTFKLTGKLDGCVYTILEKEVVLPVLCWNILGEKVRLEQIHIM